MNVKTPAEFLTKYRKFVNRYAEHDRDCGLNPNNLCSLYDWCTCGFSDKIKELQELSKQVEVIDENH